MKITPMAPLPLRPTAPRPPRRPPSPCVNVCRMDAASGWCVGCARTIDEIATWSTLGGERRESVWQALEPRRSKLVAAGVWAGPAAPETSEPEAPDGRR